MGDRATVTFVNERKTSPSVYLHWNGSEVPELIAKCYRLMEGRRDDIDYVVARFIGVCHEFIDGNLSLGVFNATRPWHENEDAVERSAASPRDAGFVVVQILRDDTWRIQVYGGYGLILEDDKPAVHDALLTPTGWKAELADTELTR